MPQIISSPAVVIIPYQDSATFTVKFELGWEFPEHTANATYPTLYIPSLEPESGQYIHGRHITMTSSEFTVDYQRTINSSLDAQILLRYENSNTLVGSKPITLVYEERPERPSGPNRP